MQDSHFRFKDIVQHQHFDCEDDKLWAIRDACIDAMEEGTLPVTALGGKGRYYLWENYILTVDQWARICALLQRHRLPPSLLWKGHSVAYNVLLDRDILNVNPVIAAALSCIDYLWQDLDVIDAWIEREQTTHATRDIPRIHWVQAEVDRRRQWLAGLRAAWLRAVVV